MKLSTSQQTQKFNRSVLGGFVAKSFLVGAAALSTLTPGTAETNLSGAGATFPAPLYQRWAVEFNKVNPDIQINYQAVGSGAGIKNFTMDVVDFGASDAAMTDEEMAKVSKGVVLIPATAGTVVLSYNLPGIDNLQLTPDIVSGIFLGKIKSWDDASIKAANPGVNLPSEPINVAYRSDGSGTTFVFTTYLSAISPEWEDEVGAAKSVEFPVGSGGKGNEGVTALIKQTPGTIGYIEYGYAEGNKLPMAALQNKSGKFVKPSEASGTAALASVDLPANLRAWPKNPPGDDVYPIATFTWLLLYKKYDDEAKKKALLEFVNYGLTTGQSFSTELGYIPLPANVVEKAKAALATIE